MGDIHIENMFARKSAIRRRGETLVKYTAASGLEDWIGNISGTIAGTGSTPYYTTQIPNVKQAMSISLGNDVTSIGDNAFRDCSGLTGVTIPNSVTNIGYCAFYNCSRLTSMTIPNSVTGIGYNAFSGCSGLTSVTIPDSVTYIGNLAFHYCNGLTNVTIGSGVSTIPQNAFNGCNRCMIFDFRRSTSVPSLGNLDVFYNTPSNKEIIVPDALYDDWIAASNWSSTTNNIVNCIVKASQSSLGPLAT